MINVRMEISEIETRKQQVTSTKPKVVYFKKTNKIVKPLSKLTNKKKKREREETEITKIKNNN